MASCYKMKKAFHFFFCPLSARQMGHGIRVTLKLKGKSTNVNGGFKVMINKFVALLDSVETTICSTNQIPRPQPSKNGRYLIKHLFSCWHVTLNVKRRLFKAASWNTQKTMRHSISQSISTAGKLNACRYCNRLQKIMFHVQGTYWKSLDFISSDWLFNCFGRSCCFG